MTQPHKIISLLELHSGRLDKENIVEQAATAGNSEFFSGVKLALDSIITFGLKQIPIKTDEDGPGLAWDEFVGVTDKFVNRTLTGNAARDKVFELMQKSTVEEWNNWYRRILIKDLRCGVSEKTINKVVEKSWPDYMVPVFGCQLAHDSVNHESKVSGKKLIETKLDGVRILTIVWPSGQVVQYSRNGKELHNFNAIKQQFSALAKHFDQPYVFDGEIMSSSFQDLMRQVHRKSNVDADDAVLYLFDMIPLADFEKGYYAVPQKKRSEMLRYWFEQRGFFLQLVNVRLLDQELVDIDTPEGEARFKEINKSAVDGGYEGIMIKDPEAPYECKRSVSWLKLKPFIELTLTAIRVDEGTGKNQGRMGAVLFEGIDDGKTVTVSVGGGWTDKDRDDIWKYRYEVPGNLADIRADAVTQNQDGTYSMRFPRFKIWRGFRPGQKI